MRNHYFSFKDYLIKKYGEPHYRIPIDLALSCPHKKNKDDGCIFCAEDGARAVHLSKHLNLKQQVKNGIDYVENRYKANGKYIAYFQAYTNTNAEPATLKKLYEEVLACANFKIVIISTRPDCLSSEIISLLTKLNQKYDLWVELGVQSANDLTLDKINRGHTFSAVKKAVTELHKVNIKTVAHIIIGLPDESHKDYIITIDELNKLPFTAYKIHNLLLLKNSPLAKFYNKANISKQAGEIYIPKIGTVNLMNEFEYAGTLIDLIRRIPENRPLLRLTADAPENNIIGPKWNLSKGQLLELIKNTMQENKYCQGELIQRKKNREKGIEKKDKTQQNSNYGPRISDCELISPLSCLKVKTNDNSYTFYSPKYKENYHSIAGAASEAEQKFLVPSNLSERLKNKNNIKLLDIGFGLGYNAISAIKVSLSLSKSLSIISFEIDSNTLKMGLSLFHNDSIENEILSALIEKSEWHRNTNSIKLFTGDARKTLLNFNTTYDIIFLDAFSPQKNPELWTYDFIREMYKRMNDNSILVTYSSAFPIRGALLRAGFFVGETKPFGRKKGGTAASKNKDNITLPLAEKDLNIILKSTAGVSYRDPEFTKTNKQIFNYKDKLSKRLRLKGIPKWYK